MKKTDPLQITLHFFKNAIHYNYITITIITGLPQGYIHVYFHNNETSPLKPLGQSKPNFMWSILRKRKKKVYINGLGHMTKMATMAINSKNL